MSAEPHTHLGAGDAPAPATACGWPKTQWSELRRLADSGSEEAVDALGRLSQAYQPALLGFTRRWGLNDDRAREAVQAFLCDLIKRGSLTSLSPEKGRFRSFLRVCLRNFLNNWVIKNPLPLPGPGAAGDDAEDCPPGSPEVADTRTPDQVLDEIWAWQLVELGLAKLRDEYTKSNRGQLFEDLRPWLPGGQPTVSRAELALRLGMTTNAIEQAIHRLRVRFGNVLRELVAETVDSPAVAEEELRYLLGVLAR